MLLLYSLAWILLPALLVYIAILTIVFFHWRNHPSFAPVFNFKRPSWLALFISLGMIALGFVGATLVPALSHLLHIPYNKLGLQDVTCIAFILLMLAGAFCCLVSSICCLWHLIAAFFYYVRSKQNHN